MQRRAVLDPIEIETEPGKGATDKVGRAEPCLPAGVPRPPIRIVLFVKRRHTAHLVERSGVEMRKSPDALISAGV